MENNFELKVISTMIECGEILREKGYSVKIKFWGVDAISLDDVDANTLKNTLSNSFYNVFETLLREGGAFNAYELEAFAKMFDVTTNEVANLLNNMMILAYDALIEMAQDMSDEVIDKYSSVFVIETLEFGGR